MKRTIFIFLAAAVILTGAADTFNSRSLEAQIRSAVNKERVKYNLQPLKRSEKLTLIARAHSKDMVKRNYTSHDTPEGIGPDERAKRAGFNIVKKKKNVIITGVGENIFEEQNVIREDGVERPFLESMDKTTKKAVEGWMKSPGHRKNILNPEYTITGVGVAVSKDKKVKITQVFF